MLKRNLKNRGNGAWEIRLRVVVGYGRTDDRVGMRIAGRGRGQGIGVRVCRCVRLKLGLSALKCQASYESSVQRSSQLLHLRVTILGTRPGNHKRKDLDDVLAGGRGSASVGELVHVLEHHQRYRDLTSGSVTVDHQLALVQQDFHSRY